MTGLSKAVFKRGAAELRVLSERVWPMGRRDLAMLWSAVLVVLLAAILSGSALRIINVRLGDVLDSGIFGVAKASPQVYSYIKGRPLEVCSTHPEDRAAALQQLRADPNRWSSLGDGIRKHHAASSNLLSQPCRGEWRWQPNSGHLYAQIGRDLPFAWVFVRTGLTEVDVLLGIVVLSMLGLAVVPYLAWRASGSLAAAALSGAASGSVGFLISIKHLGEIRALILASVSFLATALVLGVLSSQKRSGWPRSLLYNAALIGSLVIVSLSYLFLAPAANSLFAYLAPGLAAASALLVQDWRAFARSAITLAIVASVMANYLGFTSAILAPVTPVNFGAGGTFASLALTTGFWTERPNSLAVPLGDYGVFLGADIDPILSKFGKDVTEYQTYGYYGKYVLKSVLSQPIEAIQHILARFFWKLMFLDRLIPDGRIVGIRGWALALLVTTSIICFIVAVARPRIAGAVVVAFPLFNFFALDMITHVVHVHAGYYESGLIGLLILVPTVAALAYQAGVVLVSGCRRPGLVAWLKRRRILGIPNIGIVAIASVLLILPALRGVQRQFAVFDLMYYPWLGVFYNHTKLRDGQRVPRWWPDLPDQVLQKLDALRALGYAPAAVSMYGVWTLRKYAEWVWILDAQGNPAPHLTGFTAEQVKELRRQSLNLSMALFERALGEDPDNPLIPAQAMLVYGAEYPRALPIFKTALDRWPDHPFGGWMALNLVSQTGGEERERYAQIYEQHASRFLHAAARNRPGFLTFPSLQTKGLTVHNHKSGLLVTISPGTEAVFGPAEMHGSTRGTLMFFAQLASGQATARLRLTSNSGTRDTEPSPFQDPDLIRYRKIDWTGGDPVHRLDLVVQAGPAGAKIFISDFYPLVLAPRVSRQAS